MSFDFEVTKFEMEVLHHSPDKDKWPNWPTGAWSVRYFVKYAKEFLDPEGGLSMPPDAIEEGSFTIEGNNERLDIAMIAAATLLTQTLYIHSHIG